MSVTLWLLAAAWLLIALGWFVLHGWIVPRIGEFRPRLEIAAGKALGVPVRIGQITAKSEGVLPFFELADVRLLDARGDVALRLPRIAGVLTPTSLWGLGFEQLLIEQPELDVRRASDGKFYVGGLPVSERKDSGDGTAVDWIFSQTELVIRGGTVRWTDELRQAPPLALTGVDWVLRNSRHRHAIRLDATPPPDLGDRFSLRGIFRQPLLSNRAGDFTDWSGQMYGEVTRSDLGRITQYADFQKLGITLASGNGALRAWADVKDGQLAGGLADVALQGVEAKLGSQLDALAFDSVSGRIGGARRADGFDFNTENLRFRTRDGLQWPGGNMALMHTSREGQRAEHTELTADKLDLAALAQIASRLPVGPDTHARIQSFAPSGLVESVKARWQGPLESLLTFAASGRVSALSLAGGPPGMGGQAPNKHETPGRPGLTGGAIDFDMTQDGGKAQIRINNGSIDFPGVFEESRVPFDRLSAEATWKVAGQSIDVRVRNLQFANADAEGQAQVGWHTDDAATSTTQAAQGAASKPASAASALPPTDRRFPGVLDLQGTLTRGNGAQVHRYLPLVLAEPVRHYVRDAVVAGAVSDVNFKVKGPVNAIPYTNPALGEFRVTAKVQGGQYAYVPKALQPANALPWPALTDLNGELVFMRTALEVNNASGKVAGLPDMQLLKASAKIPDLLRNATVDVNLEARGPVSDALAFVNTSPLLDITSQGLSKTVASGPADYRFHLSLPIHAIATSRVEGTVTLAGNDAQFAPGTPALTNMRGAVNITERSFNVNGAQARMLGGDVRVEGGLQPARAGDSDAGPVAFKAEGTLSADGLRQLKDIGIVSRLAQNASGTAAYSASLAFRKGTTEVSVSSNLQGMALSLPAPMTKASEAALPVRFENTLLTDSLKPGQALQDRLALTIGSLAAISYVRDISSAQPRVIRGSIAIGLEAGETAQLPENGVTANINLAQVNLDAWEKILDSATSAPQAGAAAATPTATGSSSAALALGYLPTTMAIRAKELNVQGRKLHNVVVGGSRDGLNWRANIDAAELNGYVEFRQPGGAGGPGGGRVYARLARLSLAPATANEVEALLDEQPANIPALDIVVDDLELRGKKLGRVEIDAVNRSGSLAARDGAREWRLNKLNVTMPEAVLTATGNWAAPLAADLAAIPVVDRPAQERRRTTMNFRLDVTDSGELLRRFGKGDLIRRGRGRLEGQIGWAGSPLSLDYPSLAGQFNVSMESGQFVKADPGIAKLLGVLSLQSLPRRLTLDFRDVFSEGFAFDFVRGDVNIKQGIAQTNNLQMSGVNAAVLMEGRADISRETQDLKVVVVPEINAGTASLIATVINPAIGLGTFLAQLFLRKPLMEAATQEFHIDGTWTDPKITKIDRRAAARSAESSAPPVTR